MIDGSGADRPLGDMPIPELRQHGYAVVDWIADYLTRIEDFPVLARVAPGEIAASLPLLAPENGEEMEAILSDLDSRIVPGVTHWNHPGFFAYFATSA